MGRRARARRQLRATNYQTQVLHNDNLRREQALRGSPGGETPPAPGPAVPTESAWSNRATLLAAIGTTVVVVAAMAWAALSSDNSNTKAARTHSVTGTVALVDSDALMVPGAPCTGVGSFLWRGGTPEVVATDVSGVEAGSGDVVTPGTAATKSTCDLPFRITGMPDAESYTFSIGDEASKTLSRAELAAAGWQVRLMVTR